MTQDSDGMEKLARQLHEWYLEATLHLSPDSFNHNAQKSYDELTPQQKYIDQLIADRLLAREQSIRAEYDERLKIWQESEQAVKLLLSRSEAKISELEEEVKKGMRLALKYKALEAKISEARKVLEDYKSQFSKTDLMMLESFGEFVAIDSAIEILK